MTGHEELKADRDQWRELARVEAEWSERWKARALSAEEEMTKWDAHGARMLNDYLDERDKRIAVEGRLQSLRQAILDAEVQCDDGEKAQARLDKLAAAIRAQGE